MTYNRAAGALVYVGTRCTDVLGCSGGSARPDTFGVAINVTMGPEQIAAKGDPPFYLMQDRQSQAAEIAVVTVAPR